MKTLARILLTQLCCIPLFVTNAAARDGDFRSGATRGGAPQRHSVARPSGDRSYRSSPHTTRNPITHSRISRPSPGPTIRPTTRPTPMPRPTARQERPTIQSYPRPTAKRERSATRPVPRLKRPETRPETRPATRPGSVTYPRPSPGRYHEGVTRPARPSPGSADVTRPGVKISRPEISRPAGRPVTRPGQNTRSVQRPDFTRPSSRPGGRRDNWWDFGHPGTRPGGFPVRESARINDNFRKHINWSTNRRYWGYNPWWNRHSTHPWYAGCWNRGWSPAYYRSYYPYYYYGYRPWPGYVVYDDRWAIGWGLLGWSLGNLFYDTGYRTYINPYPVAPVSEVITYTEPITALAAKTAPADNQETAAITRRSESLIAESQDAFKQGNYLAALDFADKAVLAAPGDGALHEYRALVLFALGKFHEAAGVLHPVLAGGPGWDWTTMISLYKTQETYASQLAALENYSRFKPDAADLRFLLGYHYMVCGHLEQAHVQFDAAARLQPADSVSAELRELTKATSASGDDAAVEPEVPASVRPRPPVRLESLIGVWVSDKGDQGVVTLVLKEDGKFNWSFNKGGRTNEFGGDFSMNDNGLLVLKAEESQMVAAVELSPENKLKFVLAGGPPGDPGLIFVKM